MPLTWFFRFDLFRHRHRETDWKFMSTVTVVSGLCSIQYVTMLRGCNFTAILLFCFLLLYLHSNLNAQINYTLVCGLQNNRFKVHFWIVFLIDSVLSISLISSTHISASVISPHIHPLYFLRVLEDFLSRKGTGFQQKVEK